MNKNLINHLETLGTALGVIGAMLVALKFGGIGYKFFFASSIVLLAFAVYNRAKKMAILQGAFLLTNVIGLFNY